MNQHDITELYKRQADRVYRCAYVWLGSPTDAEDAVSEVFLKFLHKPQQFRNAEHEKAWFLKVTQNYCKDILKTTYRRQVTLGDFPETADAPAETVQLLSEVLSLPENLKSIVYLHYYEGYTLREIAKMTKTNESTLQSRLAEARRRLKEILTEES